MKKVIYLDYAAATPLDPEVLEAMRPYFSERFYNPSALYLAAKDISKDIIGSRARIAEHLGARPAEIVFAGGGSKGNNQAIHSVMQRFPGSNMVVSAIEHESILKLAAEYQGREAPVLPDGQVDLKQLEKLIDDQTVLVSIMYANNEIGTIEPLRETSRIIKSKIQDRRSKGINLPLYLHTDASQAATYLDLHVSRLGVDLMTINGGKIYGPKQTGVLYVRTGVELASAGMAGGTENVPGIMGLSKALDLVQKHRHEESERLRELQNLFMELIAEKLPQATVNGGRKHRLPSNVHVTLPGQDNERLIMALDEAGIQAAAGSACSAGSDEPSHVLKAIGLTDDEARASLRFTMGKETDEQAVRKTVDVLAKLVA